MEADKQSVLFDNRKLAGIIWPLVIEQLLNVLVGMADVLMVAYLFVRVLNFSIFFVWYAMFIDWVFRIVLFIGRFRGFPERYMNCNYSET